MTEKTLSPYYMKTLRRAKIHNVKCKLTACVHRIKEGVTDPDKVFYYEVKGSDGSYHKLTNEQDAIAAFNQLVEFEKRQIVIRL